jgi:hypothetical protein
LTSYEDGKELSHLPTAAEVERQYPNVYGYGTGMEDCMISAGVMLSMIVDRYTGEQLRFLAGRRHLRHAWDQPDVEGQRARSGATANDLCGCVGRDRQPVSS